jgi:hypothetical protein
MSSQRDELRNIYDVMMKATDEGTVPDGYYGPGTVRWATPAEMRHFKLTECPMVHLDKNGNVDCYFTETEAVTLGLH